MLLFPVAVLLHVFEEWPGISAPALVGALALAAALHTLEVGHNVFERW